MYALRFRSLFLRRVWSTAACCPLGLILSSFLHLIQVINHLKRHEYVCAIPDRLPPSNDPASFWRKKRETLKSRPLSGMTSVQQVKFPFLWYSQQPVTIFLRPVNAVHIHSIHQLYNSISCCHGNRLVSRCFNVFLFSEEANEEAGLQMPVSPSTSSRCSFTVSSSSHRTNDVISPVSCRATVFASLWT